MVTPPVNVQDSDARLPVQLKSRHREEERRTCAGGRVQLAAGVREVADVIVLRCDEVPLAERPVVSD
jgi:hypothetical protein